MEDIELYYTLYRFVGSSNVRLQYKTLSFEFLYSSEPQSEPIIAMSDSNQSSHYLSIEQAEEPLSDHNLHRSTQWH